MNTVKEYMIMIPHNFENPKGLHLKYYVTRVDGTPIDPDDEYFLLKVKGNGDSNHLAACKIAVLAYAAAIKPFLPDLANDLELRYANT